MSLIQQSGDPAFAPETDEYCDNLAKAGTEHAHQRAFFGWLNRMEFLKRFPEARMAFAVPNGGKRDQITAARLKAEGVRPGVPDVPVLVARQGYHGLLIEMKINKTGRVSGKQEEFHEEAVKEGYAVCVCWSWRHARRAFVDYVEGRPVYRNYHGMEE